ncbi:hypothetical protein [Flavivirga eckloniae]|uniref:Uncharacterized protein n=1 Tax=Flavivirga eckloniae TaxID=1803846 RepID=A0A2K9PM50_9FLAO|nr:hypothetical protein [Flavivirga eckloniae]AUP78105.1 hypothetical protein C1H87_04990 [Flavivirga eckloniae]
MKKITEYLKFDKNQRFIYGIGLILWVFLWIQDFKYITNENFFRIYLWQVIIPIVLLIGQLIFNNKTIWITLVAYVSLYSLWIIWNIIELDILIDIQRDYSPRPFWTFEKIMNWVIMILILLVTNWTVWKVKPTEIKKNDTQ